MQSRFVYALVITALSLTLGCGQPAPDSIEAGAEPDNAPVAPAGETAGETVDTKLAEASAPKKTAGAGTPKKSLLEVEPEFRFAAPPEVRLSDEELQAGWIQLFDGQTLFGWQPNNDVNWHVNEAGEIEASQGDPGLLLTTVPFADYELRCDFWIESGGNSGIFLRTLPKPQEVTTDCYELNICDSHPEYKTASLVGRAQPNTPVTGEERWMSFHVVAKGDRIVVRADDQEVLNFVDETPGLRTSGLIGLQKNEGRIRFRNIFLLPLGGEAIFNGTDLSGWRAVPGSESQFSVDDGKMQIKGGPGFLETEKSWSDFVLQFAAQTNGDDLNSGVFFRLTPGTEDAPSNGYELQIEHVFLAGDRSRPKDNAGTGAIFRRTQARWVLPEDREPFFTTLIAHGPRIAAWVNGIQMTDWEDTRPPDPNPRRGSKTAAGPFSLQGHDPGTDVSFHSFSVAPYPTGDAASLR